MRQGVTDPIDNPGRRGDTGKDVGELDDERTIVSFRPPTALLFRL